MTDKIDPITKLTTNGTTTGLTPNNGANPTFPVNKSKPFRSRPMYQPLSPPGRRHRSCYYSCCLWTTFLIIIILLLSVIASAILYALYLPQWPKFSVSNLELSQFNLTTTTVISKFNLTITSRNPNEHLTFVYDPITISISSFDANISDGSFRGFVHSTKNTTVINAVISSSDQPIEGSDMSKLRFALNNKSLRLKIELNTKVKVKVESWKMKKISIRVTCDGLQVVVPIGETTTMATTSNVKCKVDPRFKMLNWTI